MKKLLICLFATLFGFGSMYAQNAISGTIVSEKSRNFIEYASVYIDGTSKGTVTDSNGHFTLKNLNFPCRLVVSCVGYELQSFQLSTATIENLNIELKEQFKHLSEISVAGKNRRKQNLELFKRTFTGNDKWGQHAKLAQQDGLLFENIYDTITANTIFKDVETIHTFNVKTKSALAVRLPLLGYDATVDILSFQVKTSSLNQTTVYDMYTRFTPYPLTSEHQIKKIENNRLEVYYNSSIFFCRSLFNNKLKQNGFVTSIKLQDGYFIQNPKNTIEYDITPNIIKKKENEIAIIGLKGKTIGISSYNNSKQWPINLESFLITDGKPVFPKRYFCKQHNSTITFLSDTCIIYRNGTIADNNIVFSGDMATYVGGRLLPLDYEPLVTSVAKKNTAFPKADLKNLLPRTEFEKATSPELKIMKITKHIQSFSEEYPQEKVYLHFDNISYYPGETIWFKVYVVRADLHHLFGLSRL